MPGVLLERTRAFINKHSLLTHGQSLIVGVSGGPDSIALLHLLTRLNSEYGLDLTAAHLDHGLRPESAQEAEFVARTAKDWGVPAFVQRFEVAALARERHLSLEEAGRLARYETFALLGPAVAVAHNADDQVETVLMHFLRGSGLAGLRGMQPATARPAAAGGSATDLTIIRPLLAEPRSAIEAYLAENDLAYVTDASNANPAFFRNRLRHELIPLLESYNPNIRAVLRRTAAVMSGDYDMMQLLIEGARQGTILPGSELEPGPARFQLDRWRALPIPLQRHLLRQAIQGLAPGQRNIDFAPLDLALQWAQTAQSGHTADLLGGLALQIAGGELQVIRWSAVRGDLQAGGSGSNLEPLAVPGVTTYGGRKLVTSAPAAYPGDDIVLHLDPYTAYLNAGLSPFYVRTRRPGDRFQPLGLKGTAKLSDYMINNKIPVDGRAGWPLLCCGPNAETVLWVCGYAIAEQARAVASTSVIRVDVSGLAKSGR